MKKSEKRSILLGTRNIAILISILMCVWLNSCSFKEQEIGQITLANNDSTKASSERIQEVGEEQPISNESEVHNETAGIETAQESDGVSESKNSILKDELDTNSSLHNQTKDLSILGFVLNQQMDTQKSENAQNLTDIQKSENTQNLIDTRKYENAQNITDVQKTENTLYFIDTQKTENSQNHTDTVKYENIYNPKDNIDVQEVIQEQKEPNISAKVEESKDISVSEASTFSVEAFLKDLSKPQEGQLLSTEGAVTVYYYKQTDSRWSKKYYGGKDTIGKYACGPSCMSIVISSLTSNIIDPVQMSKWAYDNGYWYKESGSLHSLIPDSAEAFGLKVTGVNNDKKAASKIKEALLEGKLVVALMGKGHFTKGGHFIVLRGINADGKILVADPASSDRTSKSWELSLIVGEARAWAGADGPFWIISD